MTLLRVFIVLSLAILVAGGLVLGALIDRALRAQATEAAQSSLAEHVDGVLGPEIVQGARVSISREVPAQIRRQLSSRADVLNVKVWRLDGTLLWASSGGEGVGEREPLTGGLAEAVREGRPHAHLEEVHSGGDHAADAAVQGHDEIFEVYTPLRSSDGLQVIGAYEVYADAAGLRENIASGRREAWLVIAIVFAGLWLALVLGVRRASRVMRRQHRELQEHSAALAESYAQLEMSSIEAIEALNATVDARDPYTAGHSRRVQDIALGIGGRLDLTAEDLDILRWGGLFHDIGKIAIPDAVLLKPSGLTEDEYALMKHHADEGARIVSRLGRLRATVPAIRHHHERWDGRGYPDGLGGEAIPLLATVIGLADSWDAMTTERPYNRALSTGEALEEVLRCKGTQFSPAVVDAFLRAIEADPQRFAAPGAPVSRRETAPAAGTEPSEAPGRDRGEPATALRTRRSS